MIHDYQMYPLQFLIHTDPPEITVWFRNKWV